jgi:Phytanoyl-CoA dioxygenase (PhyH)
VCVQPPVGVLEQLVAVRIHIDDCPEESGALRVIPKSHLQGRLSRDRAEELRRQRRDRGTGRSRRRVGHAAVDSACLFKGYIAESKACAAFCVRTAESAVGARVAVGGLGAKNPLSCKRRVHLVPDRPRLVLICDHALTRNLPPDDCASDHAYAVGLGRPEHAERRF